MKRTADDIYAGYNVLHCTLAKRLCSLDKLLLYEEKYLKTVTICNLQFPSKSMILLKIYYRQK